MSELLGTFILCVIGNASVAQNIALGNAAFLDINLAYGLGCAFGVYVSAGVSGGHINPAVTISETILGKNKYNTLRGLQFFDAKRASSK